MGCAHALAYRIDKYPIAAIDVLAVPEIRSIPRIWRRCSKGLRRPSGANSPRMTKSRLPSAALIGEAAIHTARSATLQRSPTICARVICPRHSRCEMQYCALFGERRSFPDRSSPKVSKASGAEEIVVLTIQHPRGSENIGMSKFQEERRLKMY